MPENPVKPQKSQKGNLGYKKVRTCEGERNSYNKSYRGQNSSLNTYMEVTTMALSNLTGWNENNAGAACGSACGAADKPTEAPAACGAADKLTEAPAACGAADKPAETPAACGSACGAGDR